MKRGVPPELIAVLREQLNMWGMTLEGGTVEALQVYAQELVSYDRANVVGTRDLGRLWLDHVLDSLSCLLHEPLRRASSLIDVGSGGGMPGVPLHLAIEPQRTCLLESTGKKTAFLRHLSSRIPLERLEVANARAEDLGHTPGYRDAFEASTVRAVDSLSVISEYCMPFLAAGGMMVAMKGRFDSEERRAGEKAVEALGGELESVVQVPFSSSVEAKDRNLVIVRKLHATPGQYPRSVGTPRKRPLGTPK